MSNCAVINILDFMDTIGEDSLRVVLSEFSCPKNLEIQEFMRKNAIEFAKKKTSITYLMVDDKYHIQAIFAVTHKALQIMSKDLSRNVRRKLRRYAQEDEETGQITLSAFLIGQFGKNYQYDEMTKITGAQLMDAVFEVLENVQHQIGGGVVYLECEDKSQLLNFYQNKTNLFRIFGERFAEKAQTKYIQLLKTF